MLEVVRDKIGDYAQGFTLLNIFLAQSWQISNKPRYFEFYQGNDGFFHKLRKIGPLLSCDCYLLQHEDTLYSCSFMSEPFYQTYRSYLENFVRLYDDRWLNIDLFDSENCVYQKL